MNILALIKVGLLLVSKLITYASNKQLISAGEAKSAAGSLHETLEKIELARTARRNVSSDSAILRDDKFRRD